MSGKNRTSNETSQHVSRSHPWEKLSIASTLLLCVGLLLGIPASAYADSMGSSSISYSNLQISSSAGSLVWQGSWYSEGDAQAQNSLGEYNFQSASSTGGDSTTGPVPVTFATASGSAYVSTLSGTASGNSDVAGTGQASTSTQAILANTFEIMGGTGSVNVTFSADLTGDVQVANDASGVLAYAEAYFLINLNGNPALFFDSPLSVGPSAFQDAPICYGTGCSQNLTNMMSLSYNTPYYVYIEGDAESSAYRIPEPPVAILLFLALVGIAVSAYRAERCPA